MFAKRRHERHKGKARPWDCNSYRKRWHALRAKLAAEGHAEAADFWLREFRQGFKTRLTLAGVPELLVKRLQGHALDVSQAYFEPSRADLEDAIRHLDWTPDHEAVQVTEAASVG